jgi:hypothetical protein
MEQTVEVTESATKFEGFLRNLFADVMPSWLLFMLIGVIIAIIILGSMRRRGFPFFGLVIIAVLVFVLLAGNGIIEADDVFKSESINEDIPVLEKEEFIDKDEGLPDEDKRFNIDYDALRKIKEGFVELFTKES